MQKVSRAEGRPVQALGPGHIEVRFVDGGHLYNRRKRAQHLVNLARVLAVALRMPFHENGLRAALVSSAQGHGRVDPEFAGSIGSRGNHAALVRFPAYHDRLAFEGWVVQFFHRHEEGVHIDVEKSHFLLWKGRRIACPSKPPSLPGPPTHEVYNVSASGSNPLELRPRPNRRKIARGSGWRWRSRCGAHGKVHIPGSAKRRLRRSFVSNSQA